MKWVELLARRSVEFGGKGLQSVHVRKPAAMREATACARRDARMERTRALNAKGLIGGRLFRRSSRSRLRIRLRSHAPISSQEQVTLVHVRCELTLLPQCFRPLAQHLVSTGGSGPAGLVVGSHAEVARAQTHCSDFVSPDVEHATVDGQLQLFAADPLSKVVVRACVGPNTLEDEAAGATALGTCELHHEMHVASLCSVLLHRCGPVLHLPTRGCRRDEGTEPDPCSGRCLSRPALVSQKHSFGANPEAFASLHQRDSCCWLCTRVRRAPRRPSSTGSSQPRITRGVEVLRVFC